MSRRGMSGGGGVSAAQLALARGYWWTWADAADRTAQSVTAADVGTKGFQQDIALKYELVSVSPTRWAPIADPTMGPWRGALGLPGVTAGIHQAGISLQANTGTQTQRTIAATNKFTLLGRNGIVSAASAGSIVHVSHSSNITVWMPALGLRRRFIAGPSQVSSSMRWFVGVTSDYTSTNADPADFLNCLGIGISGAGDANLQLYHNNGAGAATKVDLGAAFNAPRTANEGFIFDIYTFDSTTWGYQVERINNGALVSGTLSSEVPVGTTGVYNDVYANNNTDASAIAMDVSSVESWQRLY